MLPVLRPRSAEDLIDEDDFARDERLPLGRALAERAGARRAAQPPAAGRRAGRRARLRRRPSVGRGGARRRRRPGHRLVPGGARLHPGQRGRGGGRVETMAVDGARRRPRCSAARPTWWSAPTSSTRSATAPPSRPCCRACCRPAAGRSSPTRAARTRPPCWTVWGPPAGPTSARTCGTRAARTSPEPLIHVHRLTAPGVIEFGPRRGVGYTGRRAILGSSMVEHPAVNRRVAGSSPARGAYESPASAGFRSFSPTAAARSVVLQWFSVARE